MVSLLCLSIVHLVTGQVDLSIALSLYRHRFLVHHGIDGGAIFYYRLDS